ncbi:MAG: GNAT family N-acetyltransferase [Candidatus Staskawiczbacteria bacterium]|jgi:RimJ/RimL family protein N-acetyltransferase
MKNSKGITLKRAEATDIEFLWYLRNRKETRKYSRNSKKIKWDEHINWILPILLGIDNKQIFIIKNVETPIGQVGFDYKENNEAEISVSILKEFWGKDFARKAVALSIKTQKNIKHFIADIHKKNFSSLKLFKKMNFILKEKRGDWLRYRLILK